MTRLARRFRFLLAVLMCAGLAGCMDSNRSQMEEEKESHYQAGKSCLNSMDYRGAIEEFRKALKMNPDSASAHFQLGCLYEEKDPDPAAAIYHYEQFLKLRPHANNAEWIRERIINCKQDLAKTVVSITPGMQHQFEQLLDENRRLKEELERWRAYGGRFHAPTASLTQALPPRPPQDLVVSTSTIASGPTLPNRSAATARTHVVQAGESPYSIAKKYGVKLDALMAANPSLDDPRRLRTGQTLNVP
jgi:LysM repeat protein